MAASNRQIHGNYQEVLEVLAGIESADKSSEKLSKKGCGLLFLGCLTMFGSVFGVDLLGLSMVKILAGTGGLLFVIGVILYTWGKGGDSEDSRYLAVRRIHEYLGKDCHESANFRYSVDFRPFDTLRFFKRIQFPGFFKGRIYHYLTPLIRCQVTLRDGTRLRIEFDKLTRKRSRWKFNSRMKLKFKTKYKYLDVVKIYVRLPKSAPLLPLTTVVEQHPSLTGTKEPKLKIEGRKVAAHLVHKNKRDNADPRAVLNGLTWTFYQIQTNRPS